MQLSICVPAREKVHTIFMKSLVDLTNRLTNLGIEWNLHIVSSSVICESRTQLANQALESGATHLLWLDSDMYIPSNVIHLFSHDKDIVAGAYSTKHSPFQSVAFTDPTDMSKRLTAQTGLHKIWAVGMGCMLVRKEVFESLPKPWFAHEYNKILDTHSGEDIYFCNQAMHHGFDTYIDTDLRLAHIGLKTNIL
tara:strand:+ start:4142 stop:4723 length:582 start_codon:yes stop_codon:yes gene_type:complete